VSVNSTQWQWLAALAVVLIGTSALLTSYLLSPERTPAGQPPLVFLSAQNLTSFKEAFNAAGAETRLIAFLSPT